MKKLEHFKVVALNIEILGIVKIKTALAVRTRSLAFAWPSLSNLLIYVIQKIADFMYVYQRYIIFHKMCQKWNYSFAVQFSQGRNAAFGVREGESKSLVRDGQLPF